MARLTELWHAIQHWYQGEYIPPNNSPNSPVFVVMGRYRRHWSSNFIHIMVEFYYKEWKWLLPFLVALCGVMVAIARLK
jgi:hypothetical protein